MQIHHLLIVDNLAEVDQYVRRSVDRPQHVCMSLEKYIELLMDFEVIVLLSISMAMTIQQYRELFVLLQHQIEHLEDDPLSQVHQRRDTRG